MKRDTTYIVILNWNGWRDTIACLASVFSSVDTPFRVIVCDNASTDESLLHIAQWARGELQCETPANPRMACLVSTPQLPLKCCRVNRQQAESGQQFTDTNLVLVDNGANLGFAAGNNVGLRCALQQPDLHSVWLLNNDTLVEPDCLTAMRAQLSADNERAICGSTIHFFDDPAVLQAVGGNPFDTWTGIAGKSLGRHHSEHHPPSLRDVYAKLDYLSGCSMLLPRDALLEVGLLNEDYFLYYEEIDWFTRNRGRFPMRVATNAHLYHREGSAIGSPTTGREASAVSDFHLFYSRLAFMRSHYPKRLPLTYLGVLKEAIKRIISGRIASVSTIGRAVMAHSHG